MTLTPNEIRQAAFVGIMRRTFALERRHNGQHGIRATDDLWAIDIEGACGELAVARYLNLAWTGSWGSSFGRDVGGFVEVKTRLIERNPARTDLMLDRQVDDATIAVLVYARSPSYELVGWIHGRDGKRPEYWKDPAGGRPAFFIQPAALKPIEVLRSMLAGAPV